MKDRIRNEEEEEEEASNMILKMKLKITWNERKK